MSGNLDSSGPFPPCPHDQQAGCGVQAMSQEVWAAQAHSHHVHVNLLGLGDRTEAMSLPPIGWVPGPICGSEQDSPHLPHPSTLPSKYHLPNCGWGHQDAAAHGNLQDGHTV